MTNSRVIIVGAGIGGLAAAVSLSARGFDVCVVERAAKPGGKLRELGPPDRPIDAGPTVFTMRWVFDELFDEIGESFESHLKLAPAETLARHAWSQGERLDLFADPKRSADAIGDFAGAEAARGYLKFCERTRAIFEALDQSFIRKSEPSLPNLVRHSGLRGLGSLAKISPFTTMWRELGRYFRDPRLRQLFGRYATYCGASPFEAPATLMLVAHVEQTGVWFVEKGMHHIAEVMATRAQAHGAKILYDTHVAQILQNGGRATGIRLAHGEELSADAVIFNGDVEALSGGLLGEAVSRHMPPPASPDRSQSAITWAMVAGTSGFPLVRHNVFFSPRYEAEFEDVFRRKRLPTAPTVYVCAQDRSEDSAPPPPNQERLLCLVNAPAIGHERAFSPSEIEACETSAFSTLERCGLTVQRTPETTTLTTPREFEALFPASGGALYGRAPHGWQASFARPGCRTNLPGLFLAGGSVHPGPGVPMAALSGRMAAESLVKDLAST